MSIKQNITSLQNLFEQVNNLPEAENLDTEISTQTTLLSEQDAKIAELAEILAGKAAGGNTTIKIATVDIDVSNGSICTYVGENGITTISNIVTTIDVIIPSICYVRSDTGYFFSNLVYNGNTTTLFHAMNNAIFRIDGDAYIFAKGLPLGGGGSE